jgi:RNase P subunit RPR2
MNDRKKVILKKRTTCKKCKRDIGQGLTAIAAASKNGEEREYWHECPDCARDWYAL